MGSIIVQSGMMKDLFVLQEPPFPSQGSIFMVFDDLKYGWASGTLSSRSTQFLLKRIL